MGYKHAEDRRKYHREYMAERRSWFISHRMCSECGKQDAYTLNGRRRCFECSEKRRKTEIEYIKPEKPWKEPAKRWEDGFCYICGKPAVKGETKWSGKPLKVCETHYESIQKTGERGRAAYKEKHGETLGQYTFRKWNHIPASQKKSE